VDIAHHLDGEIEGRARFAIRRSGPVVMLDLFCQFGMPGYETEILSVSFDSIEAVVRP